MKESVIFQEIDAAAFQRGIQREQALILRQLQHQIGDLNLDVRSQIEALPLEQLENLGEALLDFSSVTDLDNWLQSNS